MFSPWVIVVGATQRGGCLGLARIERTHTHVAGWWFLSSKFRLNFNLREWMKYHNYDSSSLDIRIACLLCCCCCAIPASCTHVHMKYVRSFLYHLLNRTHNFGTLDFKL